MLLWIVTRYPCVVCAKQRIIRIFRLWELLQVPKFYYVYRWESYEKCIVFLGYFFSQYCLSVKFLGSGKI